MEVKIIACYTEDGADVFEREINKALSDGYELYGNAFTSFEKIMDDSGLTSNKYNVLSDGVTSLTYCGVLFQTMVKK